jgi:hypothetical protein
MRRSLRRRCPNLPIIAVSGAITLFDYRDAMEPPRDYLAWRPSSGPSLPCKNLFNRANCCGRLAAVVHDTHEIGGVLSP